MSGISSRKILYAIFAVLAVATVAVGLWPSNDDGDAVLTRERRRKRLPLISTTNAPSVARVKIEDAQRAMTNNVAQTQRKFKIATEGNEEADWVDEDGNPWPKEQKQLMRAMSQAMEDDDFSSLRSLSDLVMDCPNAEIRERYVENLGWFWEQAVPELLGFMADPNEDVAQAAKDQWIDGVQTIENDAEKAVLLINVSKVMTDSEALESFADELIAMDELLALQTIVDTIDSGTPQAVKAVKDTYETITGEEWSDVEAAEKWLQENYAGAEELMNGGAEGETAAYGSAADGDAVGETAVMRGDAVQEEAIP